MGHLAALLTIIFWSTTYASTVILLESFEPMSSVGASARQYQPPSQAARLMAAFISS